MRELYLRRENVMSQPINVPIIDVSPLWKGEFRDKMDVANQIHEASKDSGFFYAAGHDIDVEKLQSIVNAFHQTMTDEEKWQLAIKAYNKDSPRIDTGYYMAVPGKKAVESYSYVNPLFTHDHPMIKAGVPLHEVNIWPNQNKHSDFRSFCEDYYWSMFGLASSLLRGFALALGQTEYFFDDHFQKDSTLSSLRLIRYPYLENYPPVQIAPDGALLSFGDHLDVSLITILFQTPTPNLQVELAGKWYDVPTSADNFLINCGTYMSHITNNYFHAPNHRVKYVNAERLSIPFFVGLSYESIIFPFSPHTSEENVDLKNVDNQSISHGQFTQNGFDALVVKNGQT